MPAPRHSSPALRPAVIACVVLMLLSGAAMALGEPGTGPASGGSLNRPADLATIRAEVHDILSDARFAPRKSVWQWLIEKLSDLFGSPDKPASGWHRVLWVLVLIWGTLTIVAILIHVGWTLAVQLGIRLPRRGARTQEEGLRGRGPESHEELTRRMRALAARGAFREALGMMMLALVRWLDGASVVGFHASKTNGDYLREYPSGRSSRETFRRFVLAFDEAAYGGTPCSRETYARMNTLFGQVMSGVRQE